VQNLGGIWWKVQAVQYVQTACSRSMHCASSKQQVKAGLLISSVATGAGFWVPGGGVDPGESLVQGVMMRVHCKGLTPTYCNTLVAAGFWVPGGGVDPGGELGGRCSDESACLTHAYCNTVFATAEGLWVAGGGFDTGESLPRWRVHCVSVPCSTRTLRNTLLATAAGFCVPGGGVDPGESLVKGVLMRLRVQTHTHCNTLAAGFWLPGWGVDPPESRVESVLRRIACLAPHPLQHPARCRVLGVWLGRRPTGEPGGGCTA
jgi:8-oxo-dGTP pyrophosphatase MutT (NUDIX family)